MTEMYVWSMFKGYLAGFYTYPVATPVRSILGDGVDKTSGCEKF
jgi:hypothetical protein